jgi:uncharacterized protein (DUF1697 family)
MERRPPQRHVAFLRAINVGGHTVKMAELRAHFEAMGLSRVQTYIASGNVIFQSPTAAAQLEQRIAEHLEASLGYAVATFIRSPAELAAIVARPAFPTSEMEAAGTRLHIGFLDRPPETAAQRALLGLANDVNRFHVHGREAYWLCRGRMSDSGFSGALLERTLGVAATLRNANTVRNLAARVG